MNVRTKLTSDVEGLAHQVDPLSRRGFFMTASAAAAAGYTLAAGPVSAQASRPTPRASPSATPRSRCADGEMPVYFARPANVANPPVILVAMEIFGLHEYIKDVTRRLAKLGAFAIAPDYYFRKGADLTKITEMPKLMPHRQQQAGRRAHRRSRRHGGLGQVAGRRHRPPRDHGVLPRRTHGLGYCAHNPDLKAGVAFYGSLVDPEAQKAHLAEKPDPAAPDMKAPVLGLYGEADQGIPLTQVDAMKAALQAAGKTFEIKLYPGAPHGFHADYRQSYRKEAADDAWKEMTAWFKKYNVLCLTAGGSSDGEARRFAGRRRPLHFRVPLICRESGSVP